MAESGSINRRMAGIAGYITRVLRQELEVRGHNVTRDLSNSIHTRWNHGTKSFDITMQKHGQSLNSRDIYKVFPPVDKILQWIKDKGITPYSDIKGKSKADKQERLAFAIQKSMGKNGYGLEDKNKNPIGWIQMAIDNASGTIVSILQDELRTDLGITVDRNLSRFYKK
tara:strand:+ start:13223 stop:13729 length:507 start_codon:yes stop_codon:yes gene_type:complete